MKGDRKGYTIAILHTPKKKIIRYNETSNSPSSDMTLSLFRVEFRSWHAEMRIIKFLIDNIYYRNMLASLGIVKMDVFRYTWCGNMANSSKPCDKCRKVISLFKEKYMPNTTIEIRYIENNTIKYMYI